MEDYSRDDKTEEGVKGEIGGKEGVTAMRK